MKILITGGSGFIGKALCRRLLKAGHEVHVLDTTPLDINGFEKVVFHYGNITDGTLINSGFWENIDVCYHLAAMANVDECREKRHLAFMVNLYGTFNISEICRRYNIKMIMASTACVYGNIPQHPSTEDGPTYPMDLYGMTKRAGEEIVKTLPHYIILRFGTTVGPEMRPALATSVFLNQAHEGKPFTITGNGNQSRNWIYIDDLVEGCYLALKCKTNEIFNLAGAKSYTVNYMARQCYEIVNNKKSIEKLRWIYIPAREGDVEREDISIEKAKRILGWQPKIDLQEGLKKSYEEMFK